MGTSVSSLHILGAGPDVLRAALPKTYQASAVIGRWSERFVTACPGDLAFDRLDRLACKLSKTLDCTVLSVSMFDGDVLDLSLFQSGKRLTRHFVDPERDLVLAGSAKVFCQGLGLPEDRAPQLKRLFTCTMQEDKLDILACLLGAPLFVRWGDSPEIFTFVPADPQPLETWLAEHPLPPKIKNQCKAEVIQEITDLALEHQYPIFRPLVRRDDPCHSCVCDEHGDVLGYASQGGFWFHRTPDGTLALVPLEEEGLADMLDNEIPASLEYAQLDGRLVTYGHDYAQEPFFHAYSPVQTVILADSAGLLPTPLVLTWKCEPVVAKLTLTADGGFWADIEAKFDCTVCPPKELRPAAMVKYDIHGAPLSDPPCQPPQSRHGDRELTLGGVRFRYEERGYRKPALLRRLDDGATISLPYMSDPVLSPDGTLLYAAGFEDGIVSIDMDTFSLRAERKDKSPFYAPIVDKQNRLWVNNKGCMECYTPDLALISRHRIAGEPCDHWLGPDGAPHVLTYQRSKFHTRIYRFS